MNREVICDLFFEAAIEYKDNIAFHYLDQSVISKTDQTWKATTYNELLSNVKGIASYLIKNENNPPSPPFSKGARLPSVGQGKGGLSSKIKKGDKIAIISENRPEWCASYLAISLSGGVAVPIDAQLGPHEIKNLLTDSESKLVFHSSKTEENVRKAVRDLLTSHFSL